MTVIWTIHNKSKQVEFEQSDATQLARDAGGPHYMRSAQFCTVSDMEIFNPHSCRLSLPHAHAVSHSDQPQPRSCQHRQMLLQFAMSVGRRKDILCIKHRALVIQY